MRRLWKLVTMVFVLTALMASTAFAAGWTTGRGENSSRWWHTAPMAVDTFLESYVLPGKTILSFCTSGGSDTGESMPDLL